MTYALWMVHYGFTMIYLDIPCIGGSFECDAINSWLVTKVVNIEMKSYNTSSHTYFYYFPRCTLEDHIFPLEVLSFLGSICTTR
jgi:hypothetical protein